MKEQTTFFLGANTPGGFHSMFSELYDPNDGWRAYILKGGPGTGKSTFMKNIAGKCDEAGIEYEVIRCSSDPDSLDALRIPEKKVVLADGTAPHVLDPRFPGAVDTVLDLSAYWDREKLIENRAEIVRLTRENSTHHKKCVRYLQAAESLGRDIRRLALSTVDSDKVERYASRLASRKFGTPRGTVGTESKRLLSAVTPQGVFVHRNTIEKYEDVLVLEDAYGAVAGILVGCLRRYALGAGLDVISCPCSLQIENGPEHLLVPQIGFAVVTGNTAHGFTGETTVHASRFMDKSLLKGHRSRITFSARTKKELLDEAANCMQAALTVHDKLEIPYKNAMDFGAVQALMEKISAEILS